MHELYFLRMWLSDLEVMSRNDGYDLWRDHTAQNLSNVIQKRFQKLQNQTDYDNVKVLKCSALEHCGWGKKNFSLLKIQLNLPKFKVVIFTILLIVSIWLTSSIECCVSTHQSLSTTPKGSMGF